MVDNGGCRRKFCHGIPRRITLRELIPGKGHNRHPAPPGPSNRLLGSGGRCARRGTGFQRPEEEEANRDQKAGTEQISDLRNGYARTLGVRDTGDSAPGQHNQPLFVRRGGLDHLKRRLKPSRVVAHGVSAIAQCIIAESGGCVDGTQSRSLCKIAHTSKTVGNSPCPSV